MNMPSKSLLYRISRKLMGYFNVFPCDKSLEGLVCNLEDKYGYHKTRKAQKPVDANQEPLPWFTYPTIEYLAQLDLSEKSIFEWGSGNSSQFFAKRCKQITSIESNQEWYEYSLNKILPNQKLIFRDEVGFAEVIDELSSTFDLIIIDSLRRYDCAIRSINYLNQGGFIILDNSDWHPKTSEFLRVACDLVEIDMHGFGPINPYSSTTSLYLHRDFRFSSKDGIQPKVSKAGIHQLSRYDSPSEFV